MKKIIITTLSLLFALHSFSQLSSYRFIREGGQVFYINPADSTAIEHTVSDDMVLPAKVKIGFGFVFNGQVYDSLGISENGYIWFGPAQAEELVGITNPITEQLPSSVKGVVCAFGLDLHPHVNTDLTTTIRSYREDFNGRPDNFIIEWRNTSRIDALNSAKGEDTINIQMQLFAWEQDRVQITYGSMGLNPDLSSVISVGMKGADMNDFALRVTDDTNPWDNTLAATAITQTSELSTASNPSDAPHNFMSWLSNRTTGLREHAARADFSLYPLPANNLLFIKQHGANEIKSYEIYNPSGSRVQTGEYAPEGIPVSELIPGLYIIRLNTASGVSAQRFIKD